MGDLSQMLFQRTLSEQPKIKTVFYNSCIFHTFVTENIFALFHFFLLPKSVCTVNCLLAGIPNTFYFTSEFMYHHGNEIKMLSRYGTMKTIQTLSHPYNSLERREVILVLSVAKWGFHDPLNTSVQSKLRLQ